MKTKIFLGMAVSGAVAVFIVLSSLGKSQDNSKASASHIELSFNLPQGYEFTPDSPYRLACNTGDPAVVTFAEECGENFSPLNSPYKIPFLGQLGETSVTLSGVFYYCHKESSMCFYDTFETSLPVRIENTTPVTIRYVWNIQPKKSSQ